MNIGIIGLGADDLVIALISGILGDGLEGEARDVGKTMAGIARQVVQHAQPFEMPCVLLSGGETTITLRGNGRGGRNVEFLLSLAVALDGLPGVHALAGDTDGHGFFQTLGDSVITGPTLTNIDDIRAIAIDPPNSPRYLRPKLDRNARVVTRRSARLLRAASYSNSTQPGNAD